MRTRTLLLLTLAITSCAQAQTEWKLPSDPAHCVAHPGDDHGYLLKVCKYVQTHQVLVTSDPNTWTIRRIEHKNHDKPVTLVYLSCCFLGDLAIFDDTSGDIVEYSPGPK